MLTLPSSVQIFFCMVPVDMRRSFDSLADMVRCELGEDPMSGHLFVFRNKNGDCMKVLYWDRDGYAIWYKRLEHGTFDPPDTPASAIEMNASQFSMMLGGVEFKKIRQKKRYVKQDLTV